MANSHLAWKYLAMFTPELNSQPFEIRVVGSDSQPSDASKRYGLDWNTDQLLALWVMYSGTDILDVHLPFHKWFSLCRLNILLVFQYIQIHITYIQLMSTGQPMHSVYQPMWYSSDGSSTSSEVHLNIVYTVINPPDQSPVHSNKCTLSHYGVHSLLESE